MRRYIGFVTLAALICVVASQTLVRAVRPRGAQVRALAGFSVRPDSSAKHMTVPSLRAPLLSRAIGSGANGRSLRRCV